MQSKILFNHEKRHGFELVYTKKEKFSPKDSLSNKYSRNTEIKISVTLNTK